MESNGVSIIFALCWPVALYSNIELAVYENFLLFYCVIRIVLSKHHIETVRISLPREFLKLFVTHSNRVCGTEFLVYNVHFLLHLADDAENFGVLDNISFFPFENYLGHLKSLVQAPS